jgi:hypothetical protein
LALHTDIPTRGTVEQLLAVRDPFCVSLYVPTSPLKQDVRAGQIELKTLAAEAVAQLEAVGADRGAVSELRESLDDLGADEDFWSEQARTLAVYATAESLQTFRLANRLSSAVEVGDRFYVKPLLRAISFPHAAFVLALAGGAVRLVEVQSDGPAYTVRVPDLPSSAADAARKASIADRAPKGRIQGSEGQKVRLRQFARKVDRAVRGAAGGTELPVILAAAEPMATIYRSVNTYPHLVEEVIAGNPEDMSDDQLAAAARTVLDGVYARELGEVRELFETRRLQERAATDVATVARAATYGAVDTLVADIDEKVPGRVDEETGAVAFADDDASSYGVVDEIARRVLLAGGRVLAVRSAEVPDGGAVAAILRHPL